MIQKILVITSLTLISLHAQRRELPRHMFAVDGNPLTPPSSLAPRAIADSYLRSLASQANLSADDIAGAYIVKEYRTEHNGVTHIVYKQQFLGLDVYGASWVVNIAQDGSVLNAGGQLYAAPDSGAAVPAPGSSLAAVRAAALAVNPKLATRYFPFATARTTAKRVQFQRGPFAADIDGETVWYPVNGVLRLAWRFFVDDEDGSEYAVVVDDASQAVFTKDILTRFQSPQPPRGLVYDRESPQPNPNPGVLLTALPPYVDRVLQSFAGDPAASPSGWVSATETAGNNTITGENLPGISYMTNPRTAVSSNRDFSFPLLVGPEAPSPLNFADAVIANMFYWVNRAHDLFYQSGFDEASGNFQASNFGKGGVEGDRMLAYVHFGASAAGSAVLNNSSFGSRGGSQEDGSPSNVRMYLSTFPGSFYTDGALDNGVIIHEYTHGVSTRLARDVYNTYQGQAMGEAWSDFFAAEFLLPEGAPVDGAYPSGEYFTQVFGTGIRTRPYSTNMDVDPLTYAQLGHVSRFLDPHADGEIWMEALWEMRANLIRQFGEREGRRRVRLLVIDGMKLSPPAASMMDARDAILLADRVDFQGASQAQIWAAFARRGLGVLAQSVSGNSLHVLPSFETPSPRGAMRFYDDRFVLGELVTLVLQDANYTQPTVRVQLTTDSGDLETVALKRKGSAYLGSIGTTALGGAAARENGRLELVPGDTISAYYVDYDTGSGSALITASAGTVPAYSTERSRANFTFDNETPLFPANFRILSATSDQKLPFAFPFYGNTYSSVRVYSNGLLAFDLPARSPCTDSGTFSSINGIAPFYTELAVGGAAQKNENVFRSESSDSVTFHWVAETLNGGITGTGDPADFAVSLFADGRIEFLYGPGNKSAGAAPSIFGCATTLPTVGISNGHGTGRQTTVLSSYDSVNPLVWLPPFNASSTPSAVVDTPAAEAHVQDVMTVRGAAWDDAASVSRVDVFVDNVARARTTASAPRADFCSQQQVTGCPNVGFSASLNLGAMGLTPGPHQLKVRVTNTRGAFADYPDSGVEFIVDSGTSRLPKGAIEKPAAGDTISGTVTVSGYVYDEDLRITGADLLVDGITYRSVTYGATRNDVCGALAGVPNCPRVGFTVSLNTASGIIPMPNGRHTLQLQVRDETGRTSRVPDAPVPVTVSNGDRPKPVVVIESPAANQALSGVAPISGYAYVPGGKVSEVSVTVDRVTIPGGSAAVYGDARPDACAALPGAAACPNIGFHFNLDTTVLVNGPHTLQVTVLSDQGASVTAPAAFAGGLSFFVQN